MRRFFHVCTKKKKWTKKSFCEVCRVVGAKNFPKRAKKIQRLWRKGKKPLPTLGPARVFWTLEIIINYRAWTSSVFLSVQEKRVSYVVTLSLLLPWMWWL